MDSFIDAGNNSFQSLGYNLIGTGGAIGAFNQVTDMTGVLNPMLGPLADNGGPTKTHELLENSLAIDAGDPSVAYNPAQFDQRGNPFVRVFDSGGGAIMDIGAYERQTLPIPSLVVDTLSDEADGDFSPGNLSLREALSSGQRKR